MSRKRPNVVVFFTDQQRWDCATEHGNPLDLMPNFSRMASRGTHLQHSFTCQPVCGPARACWQTGRHATSHGVWNNNEPMRDDLPLLAEQFNEAGYHTGYIGKWHLATGIQGQAVPAGQRGGYQSWLASNILEFSSTAYQTRMWNERDEPVDLPGYRVDAVADAVIRHLHERSRRDEPFMLFSSFIEPHFQNHEDDYPPPDGYRSRYAGRWTPPDLAALRSYNDDEDALVGGTAQRDLGGYWGMVKRLDEALGRVLDALKSLGLLDDTIVLFTSDHGCHFKTRNREYKRSGHESSIRVPTAIQGPGFDAGGNRPELVSLVDLPATLLDACDIPIPGTFEGSSLLPRLQGRGDWRDDMFVQTSGNGVSRVIRTRRWKYGLVADHASLDGAGGASIYEEAYLYDLDCDPYELNNILRFDSHDALKDVLRQRLLKRMAEVGESRPEIRLAPTIPGGARRVDEADLRA